MAEKPFFNTATIIGVGLIGGSIARVLKNRGMAKRVIGAGRGGANIAKALELGIIDGADTPEQAVSDADLVILCPPVLSIVPTLESVAPFIKRGALVTDAGSTKKEIVEKGEKIAAGKFTFIGSHPIAGTEKSGAGASFETLFDDHKCILTPTASTPADKLETLTAFWRTAGMITIVMDPGAHDRMLGAVSHLPHLAAYALVNTVAGLEGGEGLLSFAAGGFKDTTRIAASPAEMWADIALANSAALLGMSSALRANMKEIEDAMAAGDRPRLLALFQKANAFRRQLP